MADAMAVPSCPLVRRLARLTVVATFGLILAGGLVTSRDAGLAVPDWPLSFGTLNPPRWLSIVNVRTEHGHRLIAGAVALLTIGLAIAARVRDERHAVRRAANAAVALVLFQAMLGGLRVLNLSIDLAMVHALTAQLFLCTVVVIATLASPSWARIGEHAARPGERAEATALFALVLAQLVLGIVIRHLGAAARPLLGHGVFHGHVLLALAIVWLAQRMRTGELANGDGAGHAALVLRLVFVQLALGIGAFLITETMAYDRQATMLESWIPTFHVVVGASILAAAARALLFAYAQARSSLVVGVEVAHAEGSAR
jgi:cytochrome c oxidase assembly protein subunit 15